MVWNKKQLTGDLVRQDEPSELALFAVQILRQSSRFHGDIDILDLGCGYGQDAVYLARQLDCHILAIDTSEEAVTKARKSCPRELIKRIEFLCYNYFTLIDKFDMIFISNLYYLLAPDESRKIRETVKRCLKSGGWFFLNTLSTGDSLYSKLKTKNEIEPESVPDKKSYHFSTRHELERDFSFLVINALFEREYFENHFTMDNHRHIFWLLLGSRI